MLVATREFVMCKSYHHHVAPSEGLSQLMGASPSFSGGNIVSRLHSCCFSIFVKIDFNLRMKGFFGQIL